MTAVRSQSELCDRCGTEYVLGARFCYVCGAERGSEPSPGATGLAHWLDIRVITEALGLTIASLVAFIVGITCVLAALATGFVYNATTVLDWQAVQMWRVEWLLAGIAAFVAGVLLKRS